MDLCATRSSGYARTLERRKKGTQKRYILHMFGRPMQPIVMIFCTARDLADVINPAKFCFDWFRGFGLSKGQSLGPPIGNRNGPYHCVLH